MARTGIGRLAALIVAVISLWALTALALANNGPKKDCQTETCAPLTMALQAPQRINTVQPEPQLYVVFWGPWWQSTQGQGIQRHVTSFLRALHSSPYTNIATQYYDYSGGERTYISSDWRFMGSWTSFSVPRAGAMHLGKTAVPLINASTGVLMEGLEANGIAPTSNTSILIYPETGPEGYPAHVKLAPLGQCLGEHIIDHLPSGKALSVGMIWPSASQEYTACSLASDTKAASHEWGEMITDRRDGYGWTDKKGEEIGDECSHNYHARITLGNPGEAPFQATVSPLWSAATHSCEVSSPLYHQSFLEALGGGAMGPIF